MTYETVIATGVGLLLSVGLLIVGLGIRDLLRSRK